MDSNVFHPSHILPLTPIANSKGDPAYRRRFRRVALLFLALVFVIPLTAVLVGCRGQVISDKKMGLRVIE